MRFQRVRRPAALLTVLGVGIAVAITASGLGWAEETLLSQGKSATASSAEDASFTPDNAVDGDSTTRWASAEGADPQWIQVDLGAVADITRIRLDWEAAYASAYRVEFSADGSNWTTEYTTSSGAEGVKEITSATGPARYVRVTGTERGTAWGYSLWEFEVYGGTADPPDGTLISRDRPATASSVEDGTLAPDRAVDGDSTTRWASAEGADPQWIQVDLGAVADITRIRLDWEAAYASAYRIEYSEDGSNWTTVHSTTDGAEGAAEIDAPGQGRYVRVTGTERGTAWGYSLWEFEVYGTVDVPPVESFTVVAAGDIAEQCTASDDSCIHPLTADRAEALDPDFIITMGDNQYDDARLQDFEDYYDGTWGRFNDIVRPTPGNHESYDPAGFEVGYKEYFGSIATPQGETWYSYDVGNWHFIALDSNIFDDPDQIAWLESDLAANSNDCIAAYWHHPLYSSGGHGNDPVSEPVWDRLLEYEADLVLNGHDHHYERFAPQNANGDYDPNGIVEIVGGMGGAHPYDIENVQPNSEYRNSGDFGVVELTFTDTGYSFDYVEHTGTVLDSSPEYSCH